MKPSFKDVFRPLLLRSFANLLSPQSNTSVGNYAALDFKEAEVTFAGSILLKSSSVIGTSPSVLPVPERGRYPWRRGRSRKADRFRRIRRDAL